MFFDSFQSSQSSVRSETHETVAPGGRAAGAGPTTRELPPRAGAASAHASATNANDTTAADAARASEAELFGWGQAPANANGPSASRKDDATLALAIIGSLEAGGKLDLLNLYDSAFVSLGWQQVVLNTGALGDVITRYLDAWRANHPGQDLEPHHRVLAALRDHKSAIIAGCKAAGAGGDYTTASREARATAVATRLSVINRIVGGDLPAACTRAARDPEMEGAQVGHAFDGNVGQREQGAIGRGLESASEAGVSTTVGRAMAGHAYNGGFGHAQDQLERAQVKVLKSRLLGADSAESALAEIDACLDRMKERALNSKGGKSAPYIESLHRWCIGKAPELGNGKRDLLDALASAKGADKDLLAEQLMVATWATLMYGFAYPWAKHEFTAYLTLMATDPRLQGDGSKATIWGSYKVALTRGGSGAEAKGTESKATESKGTDARKDGARAAAKPPRDQAIRAAVEALVDATGGWSTDEDELRRVLAGLDPELAPEVFAMYQRETGDDLAEVLKDEGIDYKRAPKRLGLAKLTAARIYNRAHPQYARLFDQATGHAHSANGELDPQRVAQWQGRHGLDADGHVGPLTAETARRTAGRG